jgi:hypothetical protein
MSGLVNELLSFSKAQISVSGQGLELVYVVETIWRILQRETSDPFSIIVHSIRYAGDAGPITIEAKDDGRNVWITVADEGPGLPEAELEQNSNPFIGPSLPGNAIRVVWDWDWRLCEVALKRAAAWLSVATGPPEGLKWKFVLIWPSLT